MKQALELNPRDFSILQQIALTYQALRRYKEMAATLDTRVGHSSKRYCPAEVRRAWVDLQWRSDPKALYIATIETALGRRPENRVCLSVRNGSFVVFSERDPAAVRARVVDYADRWML